ncbi:unnamed protein product, partial [Rotaria sordida]
MSAERMVSLFGILVGPRSRGIRIMII